MANDGLIRQWDGESVIIRQDRETGATILVAVHATFAGCAIGGTRMRHYAARADALDDVCRLARGMTHKWGAAGIDSGGGKAVIAVPKTLTSEARVGLLKRYGAIIQQLRGWFITGPDLGTSSEDMDIIYTAAGDFVFGRTAALGGAGDPARFTAWSVFTAMTFVAQRLWHGSLAGRTVVLQGYGHVGRLLAQYLVDAAATVVVADIRDAVRADCIARGFEVVDVAQMFDVPCDIFAPCAIGGILDIDSIAHLECAAVVGSANNQLASIADATRLHRRDILYVPDFVANCGGAIALVGLETRGWHERQGMDAIENAVLQNLEKIFTLAPEYGGSTDAAARALAEQRMRRSS